MTSTENESGFNNGVVTHRPRPGGRTAETGDRIATAVIELLVEGGAEACTFTNVAAKAGVERSTLYRRYPNRWVMMGEAFAATYAHDLSFELTGNFRDDLTCHLSRVAHTLGSPLGMAMLAAAAVARLDPEIRKTAGRFWEFRRQRQEPFVRAAIERGELPADVRLDELFAAADGPLYFRLLVIGQPVDREWVERTVDRVCRAFCRSPG